MTGKDWRKRIFRALLANDISAVALGVSGAYCLRNFGIFRLFLEEVQPLGEYAMAVPFAAVMLLGINWQLGLYDLKRRGRSFSEVYLIFKGVIYWGVLMMAAAYAVKHDFSRVILALAVVITLGALIIGRTTIGYFERKGYRSGKGLIRILIVGAGRRGRELARRLDDYALAGYRIVGFIDDRALNRKNFPVIGKVEDMNKIIKKEGVDEVYITDPALSYEEILDLITRCRDRKVRFKVAANVFSLVSGGIDITKIDSIPGLELWRAEEGWWVGWPKRVFDMVVATVFLAVSLPLWAMIAGVILLDDGAPAIIKQKRVGKGGKEFWMYKFRTMRRGVTRSGKLLRRMSLDELPQLANVIRGEMSMVGPRPELPQKTAKYSRWQKKRLEVKPGLTGLWQVLGRKDLPLEKNIEYDFYYINNQSFLMDVAVILRTIPVVISGKGAY